MAKKSNKTKPIGVRFDIDISREIMDKQNIETFQGLVNYWTYGEDVKFIAQETLSQVTNIPIIVTEVNKEDILKKIKEIEIEELPAIRDTPLGRRSWQTEKERRIDELKMKLN